MTQIFKVDGSEYKVGLRNFVFRKSYRGEWLRSGKSIEELHEEAYHQAYAEFSHVRTIENKSQALTQCDLLIKYYRDKDSKSYRHFQRKYKRIKGMLCTRGVN